MSAPNRKATGLGDGLGIWLAIGAAVVMWRRQLGSSAHLGPGWPALPRHRPTRFDLVAGLVKGRVPWPVQSTIVACVLLGMLVALTVTVLVVRLRRAHKRARVDKAAVHMGRGKTSITWHAKGARPRPSVSAWRTPRACGSAAVVAGKTPTLGPPGRTCSSSSAGPRTGKTTSTPSRRSWTHPAR